MFNEVNTWNLTLKCVWALVWAVSTANNSFEQKSLNVLLLSLCANKATFNQISKYGLRFQSFIIIKYLKRSISRGSGLKFCGVVAESNS